jgi:glucose-6-phosphate isomerase
MIVSYDFRRQIPMMTVMAAANNVEGELWQRYCQYGYQSDELGFSIDISRMPFADDYVASMARAADRAIDAMAALESGSIANRDEDRMVGHYWLRAAGLAPTPEIGAGIRAMRRHVAAFADDIRRGIIQGAGGTFTDILHIGIGGSALGPRLLGDVHIQRGHRLRLHVMDNADPDTLCTLLAVLADRLDQTLVIVASKSGTTPTPRRLLAEMISRYDRARVDFPRHAAAITSEGSLLDAQAAEQGWLARFPLWDWVGGRTSITAATGLLPAAILGADIDAFLDGGAAMDRLTRGAETSRNPAMLLALMWHWAGKGLGSRDMVVLPYRDRLAELPRYLQQLVMESLGKGLDRAGRPVHQGLTVYGNRGEPDQHAFLQQLRDGRDDAFVTFIGVHAGEAASRHPVARSSDDPTFDDHLFANLIGTRDALTGSGRPSITILLDRLDLRSLGALIALFERAVGLYAELININAYHQPGVVTDAAGGVLRLQGTVVRHLGRGRDPQTPAEVAAQIDSSPAAVHDILEHLYRSGQDVGRIAHPDPDRTRYYRMVSTASSGLSSHAAGTCRQDGK